MARETRAAGPVGRDALFALLLLAAAANALSGRVWAALDAGAAEAASGLLGVSAIIWFALFAIIRIGLAAPTVPARRTDPWVGAALFSILLVPVGVIAGAAVLGIGLYLFATSRPGEPARRIALIGLALSGPTLWGPAALALLGPEIARLDATIVGLFTALRTYDNVLIAADGSVEYIVTGGCSSLVNLTLALVLVIALAQMFGVRLSRRLVPWIALAVVVIILFNTMRLAAIGYFPTDFEFLHYGGGRTMFAAAELIAISTMAMVGVYRAARDQA